MNWKQKTIARILLMIAGILAEDASLKEELKSLNAHLSCGDMTARSVTQ